VLLGRSGFGGYGEAVDAVRGAVRRLTEAAETSELEQFCRRHGVELLVLFGSAVRGGSDPADLDVAYRFSPSSSSDVLGLLDDLSTLAGSSALDLLDLRRAGPVARERALVGSLPLYEAERGLFARAQMAAIGERMDTAWLRELDLDLMAG